MAKSRHGNLKFIDIVYNTLPSFTDVFDEETWYVFVVFFVCTTLAAVFIASKYITLRPCD